MKTEVHSNVNSTVIGMECTINDSTTSLIFKLDLTQDQFGNVENFFYYSNVKDKQTKNKKCLTKMVACIQKKLCLAAQLRPLVGPFS